MPISSKYNPRVVENRWYQYWLEHKFFFSQPDNRTPYTIVMPPPNITGVLHMGHMLNNTIQDVLLRYARLKGKNTCWVPGIDHASIATEAKVVEKLRKEGIDKNNISREEFLTHAWEWKEKHGTIILNQLKKLGVACDWNRTKFTLDKDLSKSVIKAFIYLHKKGYIYKDFRMVNWDPKARTAISNEEVIFKEEKSKLYYIKYSIFNSKNKFLTIATTRPETILGDTAVCINPQDNRYKHLTGKNCIIPLIGRKIPIIQDEYVDIEFGTGCLKITPAHDENDYHIGKRHNLEVINILSDDGKLNKNAQILIGKDRFVAREEVISMLQKAGKLLKIENYTNKVGYSERTNVIIEPKVSEQWFLRMKELAKPALQNVINDNIKFWPKKFKNIYQHWMENIQDWCISRQLWWGHRIPVYYYDKSGNFIVAENKTAALKALKDKFKFDLGGFELAYHRGNITKAEFEKAKKNARFTQLNEAELKQDEDVLDTWFSSWLWPISVFDGINKPNNKDYAYYYPTDVLVTAPEIIFFWVARMIISGYEFKQEKPFKNVYFTGIVRDKKRRKMSKQLGNSPDTLKLIDKYGADAVRIGMLLSSQAGNDLLYDEKLILQGRNFSNKIWNIFRLIDSWKNEDIPQDSASKLCVKWFKSKMQQSLHNIEKQLSEYKISDALMTIYALIKDDFSSWYLEIIKPITGENISTKTYIETKRILEKLLLLLHPFMPFITEEIWQSIKERKTSYTIMNEIFPAKHKYDKMMLKDIKIVQQIVINIRSIRKKHRIKAKEQIELSIMASNKKVNFLKTSGDFLSKIAYLKNVQLVDKKVSNSISFRVEDLECYVPLRKDTDNFDDIKKVESELAYTEGFLKTILIKLDNPNFMQNAPKKIIEKELKKKHDAENKLKILKKHLTEIL